MDLRIVIVTIAIPIAPEGSIPRIAIILIGMAIAVAVYNHHLRIVIDAVAIPAALILSQQAAEAESQQTKVREYGFHWIGLGWVGSRLW